MKANVKYTLSSLENILPNTNRKNKLPAAISISVTKVVFFNSEFEKKFIEMRIKIEAKKIELMRLPVLKNSISSRSKPWLLYLK